MTCALLGRNRDRCWSPTTACAASAPVRPTGSGGPGCGPPGCPRPGRPGPGRPESSAPAPRAPRAPAAPRRPVQPAGRRRAGQGDDAAALVLADAPGHPGAGQVSEGVDAAGIEAVQPLGDRLGWQSSRPASSATLAPSQLPVLMRARWIQLAGAWRAAASLPSRRSSAGSVGGRACRSAGMASPRCRYGHDHGTPSVTLIPDLRNAALGGPARAAPGSGRRLPRRTHSLDPTGHAGRTPGSRPAIGRPGG